MSLWSELKRRNVVRVAIAYTVTAWVVIEVATLILDIFGVSENVSKVIVALLALGLPVAMVFAWAFEVTPEGIKRESAVDHVNTATQLRARRLDLLTIGMVVLAIGILAADRFWEWPTPPESTSPPALDGQSPVAIAESQRDASWAAQQVLEVRRLSDLGKVEQAFDLAEEVAEVLPEVRQQEAFWSDFSWSADLDSIPTGARVYRQKMNAPEQEWEFLGETPLQQVRFPKFATRRVRFELEGHEPMILLQEALMGTDMPYGFNAYNPVVLDPLSEEHSAMARIPGFTVDLVEYDEYWMDRYEVSNRDFGKFLAAGGYADQQYWSEPFLENGTELTFAEAMARFTDRTGRPGPATWEGGAWPSGEGDYPVSGISWYEAAAYAKFSGKVLPAATHHKMALRMYDVNSGTIAQRSNFGDGPWAVGTNRAMTTFGLYDHIGNVREWCWNEMQNGQRCNFGTSWNDVAYRATSLTPKSPWDRSPEHGVRLAKVTDDAARLARLREPVAENKPRDFSLETPANDAEFEIYRRFYTYEPLPLNAKTTETVEKESWRRERAEFDLPSGKRGAAYLFIPTNRPPPYETVILWYGSGALNRRHIDEVQLEYMEFIIRSGRMVAAPVFWGTFDRDDPNNPITSANRYASTSATFYRDLQATWIKELSRTIDYVESRPDLHNGRLGYYGLSWGGFRAPLPLALEADRFDAAVLAVAGLSSWKFLPEADPFNFAPRVRAPVLMINGEYDAVAPRLTSGQPLFDLLGTDPALKKMVLAPSSHFMPRDILIRETLDWFDRHLTE